jgi:Alpha/beta hydrolase domain
MLTLAFRRVLVVAFLSMLSVTLAQAEVTRVEIKNRVDVLGGRSFGNVGPYETLTGTIYFAADPANPHNKIIVDLDKAPRNAQGKVEFSSDVYIIKPKDPAKGNGVLFFDVVNRGNKALLGVFSRGARSDDPKSEAEFGDAYLLKQGYTLVMVGWQFDIAMGKGKVGFTAPIATENGAPIKGWVRMWFLSDKPAPSLQYVTGYNTALYPPLDRQSRQYRLTVREGTFAPQQLIPRDDWEFARIVDGKSTPDANWITLKGGFKAGMTYEVAYETQNPPVAGLGMAAMRDAASAFKFGSNPVAPGKFAYMYGASQTGRLIRHFIYEGFTIDEAGRKAFDGAFVQTGATGLGSFNERFAQPNELGSFTQTKFPILYKTTTDPVTGREDGLGIRIPAGLEPKIFLVDSSSEYWDRGRVAALRHVSMDGTMDVEDAANVRVYHLSGTKHGAGSFPPSDGGGQLKENANDYRWAQRGLLADLDAWVRQGTEPPASRHPTLRDGTLVARQDLRFPNLPGVKQPTFVPGGYRADVPAPYSALPFLVPNVDADGNELGGVRLPIVDVPLATLTGWQFRSEQIGAPNTLIAMAGAYIPLPATKADRERRKDPRKSIEERYTSRGEYLKKVQAAAAKLAQERFVLTDDVPLLVDEAAKQWDVAMGVGRATTNQAAR